jgi:hypothetical protein
MVLSVPDSAIHVPEDFAAALCADPARAARASNSSASCRKPSTTTHAPVLAHAPNYAGRSADSSA